MRRLALPGAAGLLQILILLLLLCLVLATTFGVQAAAAAEPSRVVKAASERQIQEAVDGHTGTDELLHIVLASSIRLVKGINIGKGTGPVKLSASKAPGKDADGMPQPAAVLDGTRIKPAAPALVVRSSSALTISGLTVTGAKGAPALYATQSGPLSVIESVFKGTNNTGTYAESSGGALACVGCEQLVVDHSTFQGNAAMIGGGIFAVNVVKGVKITASWMLENKGGSEGGSVALANTFSEVSNCTFRKSETTLKTGWGGGITAHNTTLTVTDVWFDSCVAGESGAGIQTSISNVTVVRTNCTDCSSSWFAGCMFFLSRSRANISDGFFKNNAASTAGGVIHVDRSAAVEITNSVFENNTSPYGGAINGQEEGGFVKIRSSRFWNNSASDKGAAIHVENARHTLDVADTVFDSNQGGGVGGAIACTTSLCLLNNCTFTNNSAGSLGGAFWSSSATGMEINSSSITGNKALRGGAMCVEAPQRLLVYDSQLRDNTADVDGGGVLLVSVTNGTVNIVRSPIKNNTAAIGGGMMLISASNITLTDTSIEDNIAQIDPNKPLVSTVEGSFSSAGSGGGIYGTQCGVRLVNSRLVGNTAAANGGGAALQMCQTVFDQSVIENNQAESGNGGGISASVAGDKNLSAISTTLTNNSAVSGGAVFVSGPTNGVAVGHFNCDKCTLQKNRADSKAVAMDRGGGGIMATGNIEVVLTGSTADSNAATSGPGGAVHCLQCNSLSLNDCTLRSNNASGPGGGACCEQCDHVSVRSSSAESNSATAGAGLYLSLAGTGDTAAAGDRGELGVFDSKFHQNVAGGGGGSPSATAAAAGAGADGENSAAVDSGSSPAAGITSLDDTSGSGGAVVVKSPVAFKVSGSTFTSNRAASGHGGALYHQACSGSTNCTLSITSSSFDDNTADKGGGAVFTTNGTLLSLPDDCDSNGPDEDDDGTERDATPCESSSSFKSNRNKAAFGTDVASNPSRLGVASGNELAWLKQLDGGGMSTARRRLMATAEADGPDSSKSASENGGAPSRVLYLESNNRFNLQVRQLDHWGSHVVADSTKPAEATIRLMDHGTPSGKPAAAAKDAAAAQGGSLCAQSCEPGRPCITGCLTGATTVAFKNGVANFSSVGLSAPANSSLKMHVMPGGLSGVPLVDVLVRVHTCGVGEYRSAQGSCEQCPAPQINLDPYKSTNSCRTCPFGANCQAGFPTPLPGFWHSHHRSTLFHRCPSTAACTPADEGKRMLAYQQLHKHDGIPGWLENETAVGEEYLHAQCAAGRAGPLCSSCARGYGMGPGNVCRRCPSSGRAGALVAYLVVRLFDVLLVTLLTCVMLVVWSRAQGCFAGSGLQVNDSFGSANSTTALQASLSAGDSADPVVSSSKQAQAGGGSYDNGTDAEVLGHAGQLAAWVLALLDWHQLAYLIFSAAAPLTASAGSMLLALLLTTPQSTLHWVPLDCVMAPGRPGRGTTASSIISSVYPVFLTLATFGVLCILKPLSKGLAARRSRPPTSKPACTVQPSLAVAARVDSISNISPFVTSAQQVAAAAIAGTGMEPSNGNASNGKHHANGGKRHALHGSKHQELGCRGGLGGLCQGLQATLGSLGDAVVQLGLPGLFAAALVASLCYCTVDLAATVVGAFQCTALDPDDAAGMIPGERRAAQGHWWSKNLNLSCYGGAQVTAAAVAGAVCLPLLLLTIALVAAAILAARYKQNTPTGQQLYSTWLSQLWGKRGVYQQCRATDRGMSLWGRHWSEALAAVGVTFVVPFKAVNPSTWWALIALVFRIVLAVLLTAVDSALGSSVLLRAVVASGALACIQLLLAWLQPAAQKRFGRTLAGCYVLLQVLCVLTVAAETLQPVGPAARSVLYSLVVVVVTVNCLYMAFRALQSLCRCVS